MRVEDDLCEVVGVLLREPDPKSLRVWLLDERPYVRDRSDSRKPWVQMA